MYPSSVKCYDVFAFKSIANLLNDQKSNKLLRITHYLTSNSTLRLTPAPGYIQ